MVPTKIISYKIVLSVSEKLIVDEYKNFKDLLDETEKEKGK